MADRRRPITGDQIKDGTITSTDVSGSVISGQTLITSVDTTNDHLLILDATDGALKKVAPGNLGLGSGGSGISHDGSTADGVLTYKDSDEATVESNLTFDGSTLTVSGDITVNEFITHNGDADTKIRFTDDKIVLKAGNIAMVTMEKKGSAPHEVTINDGSNNIDFVVKGNGSGEGNPGMKFDASTNKLGINGVGTPDEVLHVDGNIKVVGDDPRIKIDGDTDSHPGLELYENGTRKWIIYNNYGNDNLTFKTDSNTRMTIAQSGLVSFTEGFEVGSDAAGDMLYHNGTSYVRLAKGSADQVLTMNDAATAPNWENATGGGSDTYALNFRVMTTDTMYNNKYYVKQFWNTDTYGGNSNSRVTDTDLATRNWLWIYGYHSAGIIPVDSTLTAYAVSGVKWNNGNDANANFYIWKGTAPSNGTHAGDNGNNSIITSFEIDADSDDTFKNTGTLSSGNSFSAGDVVFFAFKAATATTSQADHYMHVSLIFTTS